MQYSNGYNIATVLPALFGRLAWATTSGLNSANTTSASGRRFDDGSFHTVVNVDTVKEMAPTPADANTMFTNKQNAVIAKALQGVFNQPEFKDQLMVYHPTNELLQEADNSGFAVGIKIEISKASDMAYQVNRLELYFNAAQTFNIYLFKLGSVAPIKTKSVTTVANQKTLVTVDDWFLTPQEAGVYYVCYFQADLVGGTKAIKENICKNVPYYFNAQPFTANTVATNFDRVNNISFYSSTSQGLNLHISSFKDFSTNILNQPHLFDELIGLHMAYTVIEEILYSTESNLKERILKGQFSEIGLAMDLKGAAPISDGPKTVGLPQRIKKQEDLVREAFYPKLKAKSVNVSC